MNKLQAARQAAGLTQQQLAEKSGVSLSAIQKYERGAKDINKAQAVILKKLMDALGCQVQDIVTDPKLLEWAETTPPWLQSVCWANVEVETERVRDRIKRMQDERNGIKPEPKPVVKRTTEKIKKTITMEVEFPADFMPPDEFDEACWDNDWNSKCDDCPFYVFTDEEGNWCHFPEGGEDVGCPLKKYF